MDVLITGGTGFIGSVLVKALLARGDTVTVYTRSSRRKGDASLRYVKRLEDIPSSTLYDAFVNLAGESIAQDRWTAARKRKLLDSRGRDHGAVTGAGTAPSAAPGGAAQRLGDRLLRPAGAIHRWARTPALSTVFLTSFVSPGKTPLAGLRRSVGRVCVMRLGVVLDQGGGAFAQLDKSVQMGVMTWLGSGKQWLSWVHRHDVIRAMVFAAG
jgi:NAD dependent epimerase/dehydratase family enzyme